MLMTGLSRRHVLTGAAAASAATALTSLAGSPASAAAPRATTQAPGWYRYNVGSYQITVATDSKRSFKLPDSFVLNAKKDQVNEALLAAHMEKDMMTIPYSPIVINTGSKLIVVDTGVGEANFERSKGASGQFQSNLKAAGIDRDKVDTVIISHFHGDHINGLIKPDGSPAFPNAEILVPAVEWKYFMDDGEMSRQTTDRMKEVFAGTRTVFDALKRKVTQYDAGKEVAPGITAVATHGHTPGHQSFVVASGRGGAPATPAGATHGHTPVPHFFGAPPGGKSVYVQPAATNHPALFARNRGCHAFFDQDPKRAKKTRRKVYDMLVADKMLV